mgnify:CR=1 FL=1
MSIFSSLIKTGDNLSSFTRSLEAIQNNIANASTPGYARQRVNLTAEPFQLSAGLIGGVRAGATESMRDTYAEESVRYHTSQLSSFQQITVMLQQIDGIFGNDPDSGIRGAMSRLFDSFSEWSTAPNETNARQAVLARATELAQSFQSTANHVIRTSASVHRQIDDSVTQINGLASQLAKAASAMNASGGVDAGAEASFYAGLETLSEIADITVTRNANGTFTVLLGGEVPLLMSNQPYLLQPAVDTPAASTDPFPGAPSTTRIFDSSGNDVTSKFSGGSLHGLLRLRNEVLPSIIGDGQQQGRINLLAQHLADQVNQLLLSGEVTDPPSTPPVPLFTYDAANPARAAASLTLNPAITPHTLAAIQTTPYTAMNGIPVQLAQLRDPSDPALKIDGMNYSDYAIDIATGIGYLHSDATANQQLQSMLHLQAQNLRQQISGVSLEQEAVMLLQFQRAYQAATKVVSVLDELTQATLAMV